MGQGNDEFDHAKYFYSNFPSDFLQAVKSYNMGPWAVLPLQMKACHGFLSSLKKSIASAESEPTNLGSNGKHAKHYNTEATIIILNKLMQNVWYNRKLQVNT
jgi:hypothetical protein